MIIDSVHKAAVLTAVPWASLTGITEGSSYANHNIQEEVYDIPLSIPLSSAKPRAENLWPVSPMPWQEQSLIKLPRKYEAKHNKVKLATPYDSYIIRDINRYIAYGGLHNYITHSEN